MVYGERKAEIQYDNTLHSRFPMNTKALLDLLPSDPNGMALIVSNLQFLVSLCNFCGDQNRCIVYDDTGTGHGYLIAHV